MEQLVLFVCSTFSFVNKYVQPQMGICRWRETCWKSWTGKINIFFSLFSGPFFGPRINILQNIFLSNFPRLTSWEVNLWLLLPGCKKLLGCKCTLSTHTDYCSSSIWWKSDENKSCVKVHWLSVCISGEDLYVEQMSRRWLPYSSSQSLAWRPISHAGDSAAATKR